MKNEIKSIEVALLNRVKQILTLTGTRYHRKLSKVVAKTDTRLHKFYSVFTPDCGEKDVVDMINEMLQNEFPEYIASLVFGMRSSRESIVVCPIS